MPPKPAFTYAQLIYRAIKSLDGKATLQEICTWIMNEYEYYRYADSSAWMVSLLFDLLRTPELTLPCSEFSPSQSIFRSLV